MNKERSRCIYYGRECSGADCRGARVCSMFCSDDIVAEDAMIERLVDSLRDEYEDAWLEYIDDD